MQTRAGACPLGLGTAVVLGAILFHPGIAGADNLVANPSAERVAAGGAPEGWGLYVGSGGVKLTATTEAKHSGERSACLELTGWLAPKGPAGAAADGTASGAILLAPNNGYSAKGSLPCSPGTKYVFSFWYMGSVPSASVDVTGWPSADGDHTQRIAHPVTGGVMRPGPQWQRCTGSFRIQEGVRRFALMIRTSGNQRDGFTLGKLYVDDAEVESKSYPNGELRAIWCNLPNAPKREEGLREIRLSLDRVKAAGFNALMVWTTSQYLAASERARLLQVEPLAAWDALGEMIRAAKERGLQVHAWYAPWTYKDIARAVELRDHPEWAAVNAKGVKDKSGICLVRPEVRQFELELIDRMVDRYPDLAGVHVEEPGYNWGADYCYCDTCHQLCGQWLGLDIRKDPEAAKPAVHNLAAFMCTDFFARLRQRMTANRPGMWLSANGSGGDNPDWYIGRDWTTWARRGYLDFYVPQLYTKRLDDFIEQGRRTASRLGDCDLVTGMAVRWSGIHPEVQDPGTIKAEIAAARKMGARGFVIFHLDHCLDRHFQAVREAIEDQPARAKP